MIKRIRELLIKNTLIDLFREFDIDYEWIAKEEFIVGASNENIERSYGILFVIKKDNKVVGYRYTNPDDCEIKNLFNKYTLNHLTIINFNKDLSKRNFFNDFDGRVNTVSFQEFLNNIFNDDIASSFLSKCQNFVQNANKIIGFSTIPELSLRYLSDFKFSKLNDLKRECYNDKKYIIVNDENKKDMNFESLKDYKLSDSDYNILYENFINRNLVSSLFTYENFSECFITSEYMYSIFGDTNNFDYTSIIAGYLKFIEQLLYKLVNIILERGNNNLYIKLGKIHKNKKKKLIQAGEIVKINRRGNYVDHIKFDKKFNKNFDITMGSLIYLLEDASSEWLIQDYQHIITTLFCFTKECRNDHFHKDNINDFNIVSNIRNNTIYLAFLLIGGFNISQNNEEAYSLLGIETKKFEIVYRTLKNIPESNNRFILKFDNTNEFMAIRLYNQEVTKYNSKGDLSNSSLKFAKVDNFKVDDYEKFIDTLTEENTIIINYNNIPSDIWLIKYNGEMSKIL